MAGKTKVAHYPNCGKIDLLRAFCPGQSEKKWGCIRAENEKGMWALRLPERVRRLRIVDPQKQSVISEEVMCQRQDSLFFFAMHPDGHHLDMCGQLVDKSIAGEPYFTGNYGEVYASNGEGHEAGKRIHASRWDGKPSTLPGNILAMSAELAITSDETTVFAPDYEHYMVYAISTATNRVTDAIAVGPNPHGVGVRPTGLNR
jgi:hypothetical protein